MKKGNKKVFNFCLKERRVPEWWMMCVCARAKEVPRRNCARKLFQCRFGRDRDCMDHMLPYKETSDKYLKKRRYRPKMRWRKGSENGFSDQNFFSFQGCEMQDELKVTSDSFRMGKMTYRECDGYFKDDT